MPGASAHTSSMSRAAGRYDRLVVVDLDEAVLDIGILGHLIKWIPADKWNTAAGSDGPESPKHKMEISPDAHTRRPLAAASQALP